MATTLLLMIAGFALLYLGAEVLVRGGGALALHLGLTPLVVGLTVVAFGTSSPELVVSLKAAFDGSDSLAIGNVVGSNICNVALILGISAVVRPLKVRAQLVRLDVPIVIGCSVLLYLLLRDGALGRLEGGLLLLGIVLYTTFSLRQVRKEKQLVQQEVEAVVSAPSGSYRIEILMVLGGLGMLVLGANLFVNGAVALARTVGVTEAVIGLTVVAVGTSLPELATSVVASLHREGDLAIGNVIGSNIFNIFCILGVTALVLPLQSGDIGHVDLLVMTGLVVVLIPLMRTGFCLSRAEGALLLVLYALYLYYLWP